jgi:3-deoxy-manno-octulosonate cytidylyltransferase (CMP-KDO synthetase)
MLNFTIIIPARLASTRLANKPLADLGGKPMVVRVAERAASTGAKVWVATDNINIQEVVETAGFSCILTRADHPSGSDRLAEAVSLLQLADDAIVVNVQGDEPRIPASLIYAVAARLAEDPTLSMASACHALHDLPTIQQSQCVKVVLNAKNEALYFSRATIPFARDAFNATPPYLPSGLPVYRHIGIYAYRVGFLKRYPSLASCALEQFEALEQLRVLWHGERIGMLICNEAPEAGVDTPEDLARMQQFFLNTPSS